VVLIACGALAVLVIITLIYQASQPASVEAYQLPTAYVYDGSTDEIIIRNTDRQSWNGVTVQIDTERGLYIYNGPGLQPDTNLTIPFSKFTPPADFNVPLKLEHKLGSVTISATLSQGGSASKTFSWSQTKVVGKPVRKLH
jgi:hypothetical protein